MIWETFNSLFKTIHRQGQRVEELEARVQDLERRLSERASGPVEPQPLGHFDVEKGVPVVAENMKGRIFMIANVGDDAPSEAQRIRQQAETLEEDARRREKEG
jgi:hypothetical protein